jgi:hypothetical protein
MKTAKCAEQEEVIRILKEHGAKIVRTKKHIVWRFPDGKSWTVSSTPSDVCAWKNNLADLRSYLKLNPVERGKPGERRVKKPKTKRQKSEIAIAVASPSRPAHDLKEQLSRVRITHVESGVSTESVDAARVRPMTEPERTLFAINHSPYEGDIAAGENPPTVSDWPVKETPFTHSLEAQAEKTDGLDAKVETAPANPSGDQSYWGRFWRWVLQ